MIFVICKLCGKSNGHLYGCSEAGAASTEQGEGK
jgi:hypothetical protein